MQCAIPVLARWAAVAFALVEPGSADRVSVLDAIVADGMIAGTARLDAEIANLMEAIRAILHADIAKGMVARRAILHTDAADMVIARLTTHFVWHANIANDMEPWRAAMCAEVLAFDPQPFAVAGRAT